MNQYHVTLKESLVGQRQGFTRVYLQHHSRPVFSFGLDLMLLANQSINSEEVRRQKNRCYSSKMHSTSHHYSTRQRLVGEIYGNLLLVGKNQF